MSQSFHDGRVILHAGDCLEVLDGIAENSIDAVVTDPPYHLLSIVKRFGATGAAPAKHGSDGLYARASPGFMGKEWDGGDIAFRPETWAKVLRVLKPGGHIVAFAAPKCSHRMVCAIEDAGFEIRDGLMWLFGNGFPKSKNIGDGWGTALKPAYEPICLARKPLDGTVAANVQKLGTGAINIDACRIDADDQESLDRNLDRETITDIRGGNLMNGKPRGLPNTRRRGEASAEKRYTEIGSTNFAATPGPRGGSPSGRWPANICHDGSDEVVAAFPETSSGLLQTHHNLSESENTSMSGKNYARNPKQDSFGDSGSAARFFYSAKADASDRFGSKHPTVKPLSLMRWLVRLVTPPGGTVLDCFAGTGSTGHAALLEGFNAVLIEREAEYRADIIRRMSLVFAGAHEIAMATKKQDDHSALPLFGGTNDAGGAMDDSSTESSRGTLNRANRIEGVAP